MRVWWCEEHERPGDYPYPERGCSDYMAPAFGGKPCRMVEKDLHPAGSRVVSGEALVIEDRELAKQLLLNESFTAWLAGVNAMNDPNAEARVDELLDELLGNPDALADKEAG